MSWFDVHRGSILSPELFYQALTGTPAATRLGGWLVQREIRRRARRRNHPFPDAITGTQYYPRRTIHTGRTAGLNGDGSAWATHLCGSLARFRRPS